MELKMELMLVFCAFKMHTLNMLWCAHKEEVWLKRRERDLYRQCMETIQEMSDTLFIQQFRLDKVTFEALVEDLRRKTHIKESNEIPLEVKVLCAISFLATGSYQRIVGITHHLPQRTTSRCIRQVVDALNHPAIVGKWIVFPKTRQARGGIKQEFQRRFGLPGVIGCIDCTHVALVKPDNEEHLFYNRKGYHSLNVQMICDSDLRITNVNAKFGGATHDSHIWSSSRAESYMRELHQNNEQVWLLVIPAVIESITISSNGNSPKVKMVGGVMVDVQKGFVPMTPKSVEATTEESNYEKSRQFNINSTKLSLNERYRRLIPYMTFYYANDLATPIIDNTKSVEVEKAQIVEAKEVTNQRQPKKIFYPPRNIPRYQGNRLTQYNIASANPTKIYYKDGVPVYQSSSKVTSNSNPLFSDLPLYEYDTGRIVQKLSAKSPGFSYTGTTKRPYLNLYNEESPNIRYYLTGKEQSPKYKLVPYEQTPPINVPQTQSPSKVSYEHIPGKLPYEQAIPAKSSYEQTPVRISNNQSPLKLSYDQPPMRVAYEQSPLKAPVESPVKVSYESKLSPNDHVYETRKPVIVSVLVPKELYVKPRPVRPSFIYDNGNSYTVRKQPAIISESYYEKKRPSVVVAEPVVESGFRPIVSPGEYSTESPAYTSTLSQAAIDSNYDIEKQTLPFIESSPIKPEMKPNYYQYVVDQPVHNPSKQTVPSAVTLASLLNSLQVNKSIPKPITRENIAASIRTLLQVLNTLKAAQNPEPTSPVLSTPKPFVASKVVKLVRPEVIDAPTSEALDPELHEEPYLAHVSTPSQHLEDDEHALFGGTSQQFPLPVTSDDEGGTPGRPGVDYPVLTTIPPTSFDCKSQRYKGFFADTETRCQVWHYCDLNGGQASFLCPNGTIFSQAGLTCDWWFNVRCDSTTQLYVLNESLYKYILPHSPKFPEDYSGPLVDKYLTLKFKEMEEELKKNKNKKDDKDSVEDEDFDDETEDSVEATNDAKTSSEMDKRQLSDLSEASVIVESPGSSGKVERLEE